LAAIGLKHDAAGIDNLAIPKRINHFLRAGRYAVRLPKPPFDFFHEPMVVGMQRLAEYGAHFRIDAGLPTDPAMRTFVNHLLRKRCRQGGPYRGDRLMLAEHDQSSEGCIPPRALNQTH
jgi:hypothetical protein